MERVKKMDWLSVVQHDGKKNIKKELLRDNMYNYMG